MDDKIKTENSELLALFTAHCRAHPTERFWQALRNWSGQNFILASKNPESHYEDTFHWRGKTQ